LLKKILGTTSVQFINKLLVSLISIVIARYLGPEEYGLYSFTLSIITLATIPCIAGLTSLLMREVAHYEVTNLNDSLRGLLCWSMFYVFCSSAISIFIVYTLIKMNLFGHITNLVLLPALFLIFLKAGLSNQAAVINAFSKPILSLYPTGLIPSTLMLIALLLTNTYKISLDSVLIINIQVVVSLVSLVIGGVLIKKVLPVSLFNQCKFNFEFKKWHSALVPFTLLTLIVTLNIELATVVLGVFSDKKAVAYFKVAAQGASLVALALASVSIVIGPKIARLFKENKLNEIQLILNQSVKVVFILALPVSVMFYFYGDVIISYFFGIEYLPASPILSILIFGQVINVAVGAASLVLNMASYERETLKLVIVTLLLNCLLLYFLVPDFGGIGAAIATTVSMSFANIMMAIKVYRKTTLITWIRI
jgi:O-antigen/teichoic acid export membrane protein